MIELTQTFDITATFGFCYIALADLVIDC